MNPLSGRVPEAISESRYGIRGGGVWKVFRIVALGLGFRRETLSRRKVNAGATRGAQGGRSVNLPSNEGRQHEASLQVIRRSLLDESRELIDHASKLRDVNAHLVNRAMKLWNEYAVLLNEHSSLSKENSSLSKENLSMVNQNGSLTKENISILKENSSLKKENISILKENSSLKKEHTYYKWRSMTGNK
ncbi:hypothetical protein QYE76_003709 [Lolium multiflorum]|uniref:Uncharacterized protein n=1 Tax=Lolium multiflorum TaxID=4521 RepID=A0AAD8RQQ1_LOLMU|nr:hypothetical protein QYE76_003709 [Lolium multiflorum]